jgi:hypothetical protein
VSGDRANQRAATIQRFANGADLCTPYTPVVMFARGAVRVALELLLLPCRTRSAGAIANEPATVNDENWTTGYRGRSTA